MTLSNEPNGPRTPRPFAALLGRGLAGTGIVFFVLLLIATWLGTGARYFELRGFEWSFEIAGLTFLWVTFLGALLAELRGENAAYEAIDARLRDNARDVLSRIRAGLLLIASVFLVVSAWAMIRQSGLSPSAVLRWPMGFQHAAVLIGAAGLTLVAAVRMLRGQKRPL